jgi:hypothetical protein
VTRRTWLLSALALAGCRTTTVPPGEVRVTARLTEIPAGGIFQRDLYNYAMIMRHEVLRSGPGAPPAGTVLFVAHYNPWKPRAQAADKRVTDVGGTLETFAAGDIHHLTILPNLDERYIGALSDRYFEQHQGNAWWAVRTDRAGEP